MKVPNKVELAISASGVTRTEAQEILGFGSYIALADRLQNPSLFRLGEVESLYKHLNERGKALLKEAVLDIFMP